jgi:hypothetical protein
MDFKFKSKLEKAEQSVEKTSLKCHIQFRMLKNGKESLPTLCVIYDNVAEQMTVKEIIDKILEYAKIYYNGDFNDKGRH